MHNFAVSEAVTFSMAPIAAQMTWIGLEKLAGAKAPSALPVSGL